MELGAIGKPVAADPEVRRSRRPPVQNALAFVDAGAAEIFYEEPSDEAAA